MEFLGLRGVLEDLLDDAWLTMGVSFGIVGFEFSKEWLKNDHRSILRSILSRQVLLGI